MKQTIKLNESKLKKIVAESVKKVLKEDYYAESNSKDKYFDIVAMIKSDMNPLSQTFMAKNIDDAIIKAKKYFSRFSMYGESDVDIFYVKNNEYNGI